MLTLADLADPRFDKLSNSDPERWEEIVRGVEALTVKPWWQAPVFDKIMYAAATALITALLGSHRVSNADVRTAKAQEATAAEWVENQQNLESYSQYIYDQEAQR